MVSLSFKRHIMFLYCSFYYSCCDV